MSNADKMLIAQGRCGKLLLLWRAESVESKSIPHNAAFEKSPLGKNVVA
jgi:hypothetical protein